MTIVHTRPRPEEGPTWLRKTTERDTENDHQYLEGASPVEAVSLDKIYGDGS